MFYENRYGSPSRGECVLALAAGRDFSPEEIAEGVAVICDECYEAFNNLVGGAPGNPRGN